MNTQVNIRLPDKMLDSARDYAEKHGFGTLQEFIKEVLREKLFEELSVREIKLVRSLITLSEKKNLFGTEKELIEKLKG